MAIIRLHGWRASSYPQFLASSSNLIVQGLPNKLCGLNLTACDKFAHKLLLDHNHHRHKDLLVSATVAYHPGQTPTETRQPKLKQIGKGSRLNLPTLVHDQLHSISDSLYFLYLDTTKSATSSDLNKNTGTYTEKNGTIPNHKE